MSVETNGKFDPAGASSAAAPAVPSMAPTTGPITREELQLASRNHALPLEMLRWPITPVGMHYVLIHFDVPLIDPVNWRLRVAGLADHPHDFTLSELKHRERRTIPVTMECAGNGRSRMEPRPMSQPWDQGGIGTAEWTGTPLAPILLEAGLAPEAAELVFTGADRGVQGGSEHQYARSLSLADAMADDVLLAYEINGQPLPPQHGYPLRLLVPGWYGMTSVKWLESIEAVATPFEGYQQAVAYRFTQGPEEQGEPVQRIRVRALMAPPGIPEFMTRTRILKAGPVLLQGRAWSGAGEVERVEVSVDGQWAEAHLEPAAGPYAWRAWTFPWVAAQGSHELACRATDSSGTMQPDEPEWNYQGMANNAVQRMTVTVQG